MDGRDVFDLRPESAGCFASRRSRPARGGAESVWAERSADGARGARDRREVGAASNAGDVGDVEISGAREEKRLATDGTEFTDGGLPQRTQRAQGKKTKFLF